MSDSLEDKNYVASLSIIAADLLWVTVHKAFTKFVSQLLVSKDTDFK